MEVYYEIGEKVWYVDGYRLKISGPIEQIFIGKSGVFYKTKHDNFCEKEIVCRFNKKNMGSVEFGYKCKTETRLNKEIERISNERNEELRKAQELINKTYELEEEG